MAHDLARSGKSKIRKIREVDFACKGSRRGIFSKEFREGPYLSWTRQGSRRQTVKPILFSVGSERRRFRVKDVVRPFGILKDVLGVLLDGLLRMDDGRVVRTVFSILTGQRHESVTVL